MNPRETADMETIVRQEEETKKHVDFMQFSSTLFESQNRDTVAVIDYNLPYPKEEFLKFLVEEKGVLLHGSSNQNLEALEPQQANDIDKQFGNKEAVYAVTDPVFPIFYAIQDRTKMRGKITASGVVTDSETGESKYVFRMPKDVIASKPWTSGVVYVLDRSTFTQGVNDRGEPVNEWASEPAVRPIAKLEVNPEDFRFMNEIEPLNEA